MAFTGRNVAGADPSRPAHVQLGTDAPLTLLSPEEVEAEVMALRPASSVDVVSLEAEYLKLSDREFELLLCKLFEEDKGGTKHGVRYDDVRILNKGADRGRDVVLYRDQSPIGVVQCKRYKGTFSLPEVFRELVRFLLSAQLDARLLPDPGHFTYILALASGVSEKAADFFNESRRVTREQEATIRDCVVHATTEYSSFKGLDVVASSQYVLDTLGKLTFKLLIREELDLWLKDSKSVFPIFFSARVVVDSTAVEKGLEQIDRKMQRLVEDGARNSAEFLSAWVQHSTASFTLSVVAPSPGVRGAPPIVLDDVYVPRTIEATIDEWLAKAHDPGADGVLVAIVAPGGFGKTSLLWNCQRRIIQQYEPILCTSTQIAALVERGTFNQSLAALLEHAQRLRETGKRLVVCLDTFDVLVHRADLLEAALTLLGKLLKGGASVVLSSRPEELSQISLEGLASESVRLFLQPYDDEEFACAVERHCAAFYRGSTLGPTDIEDQADRLRNLVGLGRPLKEVCLNPLTLRMLFELYAPSAIPEDINSFRLYTEYWAAKVLGDKRAGAPISEAPGRDLSAAVEFLASQMLATGTPSLSRSQLAQHVARGSVKEFEVAELLSRNLLIRSDLGSIEFFHQTFFEYSAARHIERDMPGEIDACIAKLREFVNDGLRLPVFEQLLLIYSESTEVDSAALEAGVAGLLQESHPGLLGVGLHVHMLSDAGLRCGREFTVNAARRRDASVLKRFCQLIYNLRRNRTDEVVQLIEAAWETSEWKILLTLSQLFVWLAQNRWDLCQTQLVKKDLVGALYKTAQVSVHVERIIISIISHGISTDADWVFSTALRCIKNHRHQPVVLEFIASQVGSMSIETARWVAARVIRTVESAPSSHEGIELDPPTSCLVAIWDRYPQLCPANLPELKALNGVSLKLALRALARSSSPRLDSLRAALLMDVLDEQLSSGLHLLLHEFFIPFLVARDGQSSALADQAADCCRELLLRALGVSESGSTWPNAVGRGNVVSSFIKELYAQGAGHTQVIQVLRDIPASRWLDGSGILYMFPIALAEGSSHANDAFAAICLSPGSYGNHVSVLGGVFRILPCTSDRLSIVIRLSAATKDASLLLSYMERVEESRKWETLKGDIASQAPTLSTIARAGLDSPKSTLRSASYKLLALLVRQCIAEPPSQEDAISWVTGDSQLACRMAALPLLVEATRLGSVEATVEALLSIGESTASSLINPVVDCLRTVLGQPGVELPHQVLQRLIAFAVRKDATEPQASIIGRVIDICCAVGDSATANSATLTLIRSSDIRSFGATQKRTLGHHLDKPFQVLYRRLSAEDVQVHCDELKGMDPYLGRLVVVALCKSERPDISLHLNKILADTAVHPELLKIIQDFRQFLWKR